MNFSSLPAWAKIVGGASGAFAVFGGTVALTAAVTGSQNTALPPVMPAATPSASAPPTSSPVPSPNPAARAMAVAVLEAEAQVLGVQPADLRADFRAGTTVQALAARKSLDEAQFQTQLVADVRPLLDQDVQRGTITSTQEQNVLRRLGEVVPNWDRVGAAHRQPSPSPTG